jgi:hypothetical protein
VFNDDLFQHENKIEGTTKENVDTELTREMR